MKKVDKVNGLKPEYSKKDPGRGGRGKYYESYQSSHNPVLIKPEVASVFPAEQVVSKAFMLLIATAETAKTIAKK